MANHTWTKRIALMLVSLFSAAGCAELREGQGGLTADAGDAPLAIATQALPDAVVGKPYAFTLQAHGGAEPYAFRLLESAPQLDWLSLDPVTGRLIGIPPEVSSEPRGLRIAVEDQAQESVAKSFTLVVGACEDGEPVACFVEADGSCSVGEATCARGNAGDDCDGAVLSTDLAHCGPDCAGCERDAADACIEGECRCGEEPACEGGQTCCGEGESAHCVDLGSDPENCGACSDACPRGKGANRVGVCRGGICQAPACAPGFGACDVSEPDDCTTDVTSSDIDCGMCGRVCPMPGRSDGCRQGRCACGDDERTCSGVETCCVGEACTDLSIGARVADGIARCGDCGAELCSDPLGHGVATCEDGTCGARCDVSSEEEWADCEVPEGTTPIDCSVELLSDASHCGACGVVCPAASSAPETGHAVCAMGTCAIACADGHIECEVGSGTVPVGCFDVENDPARCGGCDMACSTQNITPACSDGACSGECAVDYGDCNGDKRSDGCEAHLPSDDAHCGECGHACAAVNREPGCAAGECTGLCTAGFGDCDDSRRNGCETSTVASLEHCGGCNRSCASLHVDNAVCEDSGCTGSCTPGYENCNGDLKLDGCEIQLDEDVDHCGGCTATPCSANNVARDCSGGQCVGECTPYVENGQSYARFDDCNHDKRADGCETDLWYDSASCGVCGGACPPGYLCAWDGFAPGCFPICEGCCCSAVGAQTPHTDSRSSAVFAGLIGLIFAVRRSGRRTRLQRAPAAHQTR